MATTEDPKQIADTGSQKEIAETGGQMTFFEHLVELRKRLISSLIAIAIGAFIGVYIGKYVIEYVTHPMLKALSDAHLDPKLIYTHPAGYFNLIITLGIYIGIVLASPVVLYQIWLFVAPALYKHERISINEYFDLTLMILLGLGLVFELPILVFFLSLFGIVTPKFLWKNIRYAILIISIVAAVITPTPDAMTMLIFMAPMVALYFIGIGVSAMVVRKKERQLSAAAEAR